MTPSSDLVQAVRTGQLSNVIAVLNAGKDTLLNDAAGEPGLPLAMACFLGYAEIARELILRGATVNAKDNQSPMSPLAMAVRGARREVVKVLIEHGAVVPEGMDVGLTENEMMLAKWKARSFNTSAGSDSPTESQLDIEEIQVKSCYGTDTDLLDAEMRRAASDT